MKRVMLPAILLVSAMLPAVNAQEKQTTKETGASRSAAQANIALAASSPVELARAALAAQGGDKFRNLKSMVLIGSVDLFSPNSTQSLPGKFVIVMAGERFRLEIQSPAFNFRQTYDGQQGSSSVRGMELPPPSKFGLNVLPKFDQPGYTVTALPNDKKRRAFRIADAEGNATDFYVDPQNGRVVSYIIPYNGNRFGVENRTLKEVDGVLVPYSFVQRLELPQGAFFAEYKVKDVKINQPVSDDLFTAPAN
ncbi:MAG: hypothetical protein ABR577_13870 [Pyrinomonadaceae bacterium]